MQSKGSRKTPFARSLQMRNVVALSLSLACCSLPVDAGPAFLQIEAPDHQYTGGWEHYVGGGVAAFDCDGDHFTDLFVAGGESPAQLLRNKTPGRGAVIQYSSETPDALALTHVTGAYPLDVDSDGFMDLVILRVGPNVLMKGGADCQFSPFPASLGFASADRWTTAFSATWEGTETLPTLAFGNYVDRKDPQGPFEACDDNALYRPKGAAYQSPRMLSPGFCALSVLFSDWGRNGRADLRISNDRHYYVRDGQEQMWAMEPIPRLFTKSDGWQQHRLWGMGIASRDITGDGIPEVYLSSMGDQRLQVLDTQSGGPSFSDAPFHLGTTAQRPHTGDDGRPSTGWHIAFGDVQNDGRDDVFIAKGNVEQMPSNALEDPNNLLIRQAGGQYLEGSVAAGVASTARSRGAALSDLNLDGLLDLVVVNRRAPLEIYQNVSPDAGNWLALSLKQTAPNVNAVGAWVEVRSGATLWAREVTTGGGHASGDMGLIHFGLGETQSVDLRVIWPDGTLSDWANLSPNRGILITRNGDKATLNSL